MEDKTKTINTHEETETSIKVKELAEKAKEDYKEKHGRSPEDDGISINVNI